jgi:hypothetical protein
MILKRAAQSPNLGINQPCDFIFDEQQGFDVELHGWWQPFLLMIRRCASLAHDRISVTKSVFSRCKLPIFMRGIFVTIGFGVRVPSQA